MRALRFVVMSLFVVSLAAPALAGSNDKLMQEVEAIGDIIAKAMVAEDWEAMLDLYTEDAISLPNGAPRMDGIEEFRKHQQEMVASGLKVTSFISQPSDVWEAGDQVIEIGTYDIEMSVPGMSETVTEKGKYMTVYVRDKTGALKIKVETWNSDVNPMEMAALDE